MNMRVYVFLGILISIFVLFTIGGLVSNSRNFMHSSSAVILLMFLPAPLISFFLTVLFDLIYKLQVFSLSRFLITYIIITVLFSILIVSVTIAKMIISESLIRYLPSDILWIFWAQSLLFFLLIVLVPLIIAIPYVLIRFHIFNSSLLKFFVGYIIMMLPVSAIYTKLLKF